MTPDAVLAAIKSAVGDPSCGPIKDSWGAIEAAVVWAMTNGQSTGDKDGGTSPGDTPATNEEATTHAAQGRKETRIIKAQEKPEG